MPLLKDSPLKTIVYGSLCVASPEQANSHSSGVIYHGEQGYNYLQDGHKVAMQNKISIRSGLSLLCKDMNFENKMNINIAVNHN